MKKRKGQKSTKILMAILILVSLVCMATSIWALFFRQPTVLAPDYAPQKEEQHAETIPNDDGEKLEQPKGGGSVSLTYSREVTIDLSEKSAGLLFANPNKSNQDMVLQIVIQDTVIVQSGTLKPGNQVNTLDLLAGAEKQLTEGVYEGNFNVLYYSQETGEKAIVNTEIPVTITVSK